MSKMSELDIHLDEMAVTLKLLDQALDATSPGGEQTRSDELCHHLDALVQQVLEHSREFVGPDDAAEIIKVIRKTVNDFDLEIEHD